jgi:hypothetical protein
VLLFPKTNRDSTASQQNQTDSQSKTLLLEVFEENFTLRNIEVDCIEQRLTSAIATRNRLINWRLVHDKLLSIAIIFHHLPPYVLLEIFDKLPHMIHVDHRKKIALIIAVKQSIDRIRPDSIENNDNNE